MKQLEHLDQKIAGYMQKWANPFLKFAFALLFVWFGILKPLGLSPAEDLLKATVKWLPFGDPDTWLILIGWWEVAIGLAFIFKKTIRIAIALLLLQMVGTFLPLIFMPEITFQNNNVFTPTMEGQYIIKNVLIIAAATVLGGSIYKQ